MRKNIFVGSAAVLCGISLFFSAACANKGAEATGGAAKTADTSKKTLQLPFATYIKKDGAMQGGTLVYGIVADAPWKGVFNSFLYTGSTDWEVALPMWANFTVGGPNHELIDGGYCNLTFDRETKTATYHIEPKLTWSDGVPVTADDIIFVYKCIGHPEYTGVRYDSDYENVVGMTEYHEGKATEISGIERIDDKTVKVAFKDFYVSILWGSGITYNAEPAHYLKDIPLKDLEGHDRVRKTPLSCGPYMINSMVEGDLVEYIPNPHWFGEKPLLDKLIVKRIAPTSLAETIKAGEVDVVPFTTSLYDQFVEFDEDGRMIKDEKGNPKMKVDNIEFVAEMSKAYSYLAMKMGTWNKEKEVCEAFPDGGKFKDKALRQAIGYAMDNDAVNEIYYHGLRMTPNFMIPPSHPGFYDATAEGYAYNPEKAKKLLDDAGYKDIDGDGFRETPDGKPLKINFLFMSGGDVAEPISQFYLQNWKDIGLNVVLNDGRLIEFNAFYDKVRGDDPSVDLYFAAWNIGSNPEPSGLYGKAAQFNMLRWVDDENERLLKELISPEAFDPAFRTKAYRAWANHIMDEAVVIPTAYRIALYAINKRVNSWDKRTGDQTNWDWNQIGVLQDKPFVNTMK